MGKILPTAEAAHNTCCANREYPDPRNLRGPRPWVMLFGNALRRQTADGTPPFRTQPGQWRMSPEKPAGKRAPSASKPPRPSIGWREWISLPSLLEQPVKAKIDTGARTSAIHAFKIRTFSLDGVDRVEFRLHPLQRLRTPVVRCEADIHDERIITSSNGQRDRRIVILVDVVLGEIRWPIELTLADRDQMGFRMLLGREALRGRFLVDPGRSYRQSKRRRSSDVTA